MSSFLKFKPRALVLIIIGTLITYGCSAQSFSKKTEHSEGTSMPCEKSAMDKSYTIINFILNDLKQHYPSTGAGGISEIKQTLTNVFVVSINQEERIDQITYELSIDESCSISIVKKEESTVNFNQ